MVFRWHRASVLVDADALIIARLNSSLQESILTDVTRKQN